MLYFILIGAILVLIILAIIIWQLLKQNHQGQDNHHLTVLAERLGFLSEQNQELKGLLDSKLKEVNEASRDQFSQTTRIMQAISKESSDYISAVTEKLTKLDETNKQIMNFSGQLQNLQDILKNSKQRGVLGEYFLEEILKNVLPPGSYQMQYKFKDGSIVDAVVLLKNHIVPIDSKFSLENYEKLIHAKDEASKDKWEKMFKQDLKNRIDETAQYIKPSEKTLDFAFMFIPSEAIYYDLLIGRVGGINNRNLIDYAFIDKKVILVSPTSFLAYLQTVLQGLKAIQIENSAKEIMSNVEKLGRHIGAYDDFMGKLGQSLSTTVNHYNNASKEFKKIDKDVARITKTEEQVEAVLLEKPNLE
jgi:DNA recombination protein RmuC